MMRLLVNFSDTTQRRAAIALLPYRQRTRREVRHKVRFSMKVLFICF